MEPSREQIEKAISYHGHYGPFLMLGLKAFFYARKVLGNVTRCDIYTVRRKPYLCTLDGIKVVSDCQINIFDGKDLQLIFYNGEQKMKMNLKVECFNRYLNRPWNELEKLADEVLENDITLLFDIVFLPTSIGG
ncbi:MAG: FmdE family protein [Nitrososphaeria archaeon]|nr:FmdE family protein [Nitrososphaeria archaeon]